LDTNEVIQYLKSTPFYNIGWKMWNYEPKLTLLVWNDEKQMTEMKLLPFPIKPYFFIKLKDYQEKKEFIENLLLDIDARIKIVPCDAENVMGEKMVKVECVIPTDVGNNCRPRLESYGIETYEADIPYRRVVMKDLDLKIADLDRKLYIDLEADTRFGFPEPEVAEARMLSVAAIDFRGNKFFICPYPSKIDEDRFYEPEYDKYEIKLIQDFMALCRKYTLIAGWNVSLWDLEYIKHRAEKLGVPIDMFYLPHMDVLDCYRITFRRSFFSHRLDDVGKYELGYGKIRDFEGEGKEEEIWNMFVKDRDKLREYNIRDCELVKGIDEKWGLIDMKVSMSQLCYTLPYEALSYLVAIDGLTLNKAGKRKPRRVFKTKQYKLFQVQNKKDEFGSYGGALILDPIPGVHHNIICLDFKAMYPTIVKTLNIGVDTYRPDKSGKFKMLHGSFTDEFESVTAEVIRYVEKVRDYRKEQRNKYPVDSHEWKYWDRMQWSTKYILLSAYGTIGSPAGRFYLKEVAENITWVGKTLISSIIQMCKNMGHEVVYSHTDSIFVKVANSEQMTIDELLKIGRELSNKLSSSSSKLFSTLFGVDNPNLIISMEKIYSDLYLPDVKMRFAGRKVWEGQPINPPILDVAGFEAKRTDWSQLSKEVELEIFNMLFDDKGIGEIKKYLDGVKEKLCSGQLDDKIVKRVTMQKNVNEYKHCPQHVRVAKTLEEKGIKVRRGDKIPFIVVGKGDKGVIPALGKHRKITHKEYLYIWDRHVLSIVKRLGIDFVKTTKLEEFV